MSAVKYHEGQKLTYKVSNQVVTVIHNTLEPGGVNEKDAIVWVETKQRTPIAIPVAEQDRYVTPEPPLKGWGAKWPLPKQ